MDISKAIAVVTGGASGLGHATAQRIVAEGGKVALLDVNEEMGQAAAKELGIALKTLYNRLSQLEIRRQAG